MALDASTKRQIDGVVKNWLAENRMFTAFEISLAVKEQGVRERHRNMKEYVHEAIAREGGATYTRTLKDVGAPVQAWVYHTLRASPDNYRPLNRTGQDQPAAQPADDGLPLRNPVPLNANTGPPASASDGAYGTDAEGRLKVSAELLRGIRAMPGSEVHLSCSALNQTIVITPPNQFLGESPDEKVTVSDDGEVLLSPETLKKAELDGMQCYLVEGSGNRISITEYDPDE
ncbi:MAG: hypothetical protein QF473_06130 [Planctomycetota bacterium]|jgi:hypothetical protein|nr:hypothetical protein [Planctomycetota bacterium]